MLCYYVCDSSRVISQWSTRLANLANVKRPVSRAGISPYSFQLAVNSHAQRTSLTDSIRGTGKGSYRASSQLNPFSVRYVIAHHLRCGGQLWA